MRLPRPGVHVDVSKNLNKLTYKKAVIWLVCIYLPGCVIMVYYSRSYAKEKCIMAH